MFSSSCKLYLVIGLSHALVHISALIVTFESRDPIRLSEHYPCNCKCSFIFLNMQVNSSFCYIVRYANITKQRFHCYLNEGIIPARYLLGSIMFVLIKVTLVLYSADLFFLPALGKDLNICTN
uniref:Gpm9 n=1 Tax=Arundo donax TaxID=35708 RepID=A0A0A9DYP9_ARUDO